jgi:molybdopterin synthase sulfur carrier subunit
MKVLYFAWLKAEIGRAEEEVSPPAHVATVADLLAWLGGRGPGYARALAGERAIRVAVNQSYARPEDRVAAGDEIAIFPPVTGG